MATDPFSVDRVGEGKRRFGLPARYTMSSVLWPKFLAPPSASRNCVRPYFARNCVRPHFGWIAIIVLVGVCVPHAASSAAGPALLPPAAQAGKPGESARVGTVGLVREIKERGLTSGNWTGVVGSLFNFDSEKDVIRVLYEVTVFFADGSQGEVMLDRDPGFKVGQRVRVTGTRIEALDP